MDADERALLDAIIAHPDEDTPRLMYADWLEEHGRPERGELIRVQCAYARLRYGSAEYERDAATLQSRSFDLMNEFEKAWIAELRLPPNRQTFCWFRRGMVGALWCSVRYFLTHSELLISAAPLERLTFRQLALSNLKSLAKSPVVASVPGIEFLMDGTSPSLIAYYVRNVPTASLRTLEITCQVIGSLWNGWTTRNVDLAQVIAKAPDLAGLHRLGLRHAGVGDEGARALIDSPHLNGLTLLDLQDNGIGEETEIALRQRFGGAVILSQADYSRFTLAELGWD